MKKCFFGLALLGFGCSASEPAPNADFSAPAGMALAGPGFAYAFVANTGAAALQVVDLGTRLSQVDLVPAPSRYQPLMIPIGQSPTALAASADGNVVLALEVSTPSLRAVDALSLRLLRNPQGGALSLDLPVNSAPTSLVSLPGPCQSARPGQTCLTRAFISLRDAQSIAVVDLLRDAAGALELQQVALLPTGGAPQRLAIHPSGTSLFATDALAADLLRIDLRPLGLQPGAAPLAVDANAFAVGRFSLAGVGPTGQGSADPAIGDALAISADARLVAVGRPRWRDVVLLAAPMNADVQDGALAPVPTDSPYLPSPSCLLSCAAATSANPNLALGCAGAHPADQAVCVVQDANAAANLGYAAATPYRAVYMGMVPSQILPLSTPAGPLALSPPCAAAADPQQHVSQSFAVAGLDGTLAILGTHDGAGALAPAYVQNDLCRAPLLGYIDDPQRTPEAYLAPCPVHPNQARFVCLGAGENNPRGQVLRQRGPVGKLSFQLDWEGVLPQASQRSGRVQADGSFVDLQGSKVLEDAGVVSAAQAAASPIGGKAYVGDSLQLLPGELGMACRDPAACHSERRIAAYQLDGAQLTYRLDPPLDPSCLPKESITYQVRVGQAHLVQAVGPSHVPVPLPQRLPLGATYGLMNAEQATLGVVFATQPLPMAAELSACVTFDSLGDVHPAVSSGHSPLLSRRLPFVFDVVDPFTLSERGSRLDPRQPNQGRVGYMPGGMVLTRQARPSLLISFTGSDALLAVDPLESTYAGAKILR
jgi:hypothetical protein